MCIDMDNIRDYQKKAIETISKYLKDDITDVDCLIVLPTGTGKTGVMTCAVNLFSNKNFLVVVPNATLPQQIKKEINSAFWEKIKYYPKKASVAKCYNETTDFSGCNTIIITIQKLLHIYKNNISDFKELSEWTDIVFYDEGHHEPSKEWAEASRNINAKTVLFTATPFRNDHGYFNTSTTYYYEYYIKEAINNKHIKSPVFHKIPREYLTDCKKIADFIAKKTQHKSIVRISGNEKIRKTKSQFKDSSPQVACCHSKFTLEKDYYNNGQSFIQNQSNYKIVLQTDMLSEGIDVPDFTDLFLFDCYDNFKSFIQIVGRVLRKNESSDKAHIYIPEENFENFTKQWTIYCEHDSKTHYYNGKLLKEDDFATVTNLHEELKFEKQANIYVSKKELIEELKEAIIKKVKNSVEIEDNIIQHKHIKQESIDLYIACYVSIKPSPHLSNKSLFDKKFEYISLVKIKKENNYYYFYYSTQRLYPFEEINDLSNMPINEMYSLFPENSDVKNVSFKSSHINQIGVNDYTYTGNSLNILPSSTEQRMSFFKNALAMYNYNGSNVSRYISSFSSKITDRYKSCDYNEYIKWCESLLNIILHKNENAYFERFAPITEAPSEAISYIAFDEMNSNFDFEDCDIFRNIYPVKDDKFTVTSDLNEKINGYINTVNGIKYVRFDPNGVSGIVLEKNKSLFQQTIKKGFILYYTKMEVPVIYSNGNYYKPNIKYTYEYAEQCELLNIIESLEDLKDCENEKIGVKYVKTINTNGFPPDSVFGVIIKELKSDKYAFDYIICDDLQCEIADFIAIDVKHSKICFIHCKHGDNKLSASAFQEVCGQAIKNLNYVISSDINHTDFIENHFNKWKRNWKGSGHETSRQIKGDITDAITTYKKIIGDINVKKEVWIVTSALSKEDFCKELVKKTHKEQYVPLMNILHYTQDNIVKSGAIMKIFCKE